MFKEQYELIYDNKTYVILSVIEMDNNQYAFANLLVEDENDITEEYSIFKKNKDVITILNDENLIEKLLPIFQKQMYKDFVAKDISS